MVLRDDRGAVLTVRKRGSSRFMLPGGKPDAGESAAETAVREVREELSIDLEPAALQPIGVFRAAAANEPGFAVESTVFVHPPVPVSQPAAEIEELRWQSLDEPYPTDLAPLLAEHVLPVLSGRQPGA
ncbi:NUDIX hydrolase [Mycobacteroides saopaulense]|nr:NUDIX domain-containing protein [Mycobacteroides saopaulense]